MPKYRRYQTSEMLTGETDLFDAKGCNTFGLTNLGNTRCTLNGNIILEPAQYFEGPAENPEVIETTKWTLVFDKVNDPLAYAPQPGAEPVIINLQPGDPPPPKLNRLLVIRSYINPA